MKKLFTKIIAILIISSLTFCFAGCEDDKSSSTIKTTQAVTENTDSNESPDKNILKNLHTFDMENGNEFAGAWKIIDGEGSQYESFVYLFDGIKEASIIIDNQGYIGTYEMKTEKDKKSGKNVKTMYSQLMFGINGSYTYKFSDDKSSVELTNIENNVKTVMQRLVSFDFIPFPEKNPRIDKKILGAWKSDNGMYLYFDENGIMYENEFDAIFTYATYKADDTVVTSKYKMGEEITNSYKYKIDGDKLTYNDYEYKKISVEELI